MISPPLSAAISPPIDRAPLAEQVAKTVSMPGNSQGRPCRPLARANSRVRRYMRRDNDPDRWHRSACTRAEKMARFRGGPRQGQVRSAQRLIPAIERLACSVVMIPPVVWAIVIMPAAVIRVTVPTPPAVIGAAPPAVRPVVGPIVIVVPMTTPVPVIAVINLRHSLLRGQVGNPG